MLRPGDRRVVDHRQPRAARRQGLPPAGDHHRRHQAEQESRAATAQSGPHGLHVQALHGHVQQGPPPFLPRPRRNVLEIDKKIII